MMIPHAYSPDTNATMICQICCDDVSSQTLTCSYCAFDACNTCVYRYITDALKEPSCMSCRKPWRREFVMEHAEKKWVRESFLPHMGNYLLEQEKMLLPEAQDEAALVTKIKQVSAEISDLPTNLQLTRKYKSKPDIFQAQLKIKQDRRAELQQELSELKTQSILYGDAGNTSLTAKEKKPTYLFKCPHDDCRGFISDEYACGTCKIDVCRNCHVELVPGETHTCKKDDRETAAFVMNSTKPCPKCKTLIMKNGGCAQMFCTVCHVAWDWNTGLVDEGVIHNPYYWDMLANRSFENPDLEALACGEMPTPHMFVAYVRRFTKSYAQEVELLSIMRKVSHIREVILPTCNIDRVRDNVDLRVAFLRNEFDETTWATKLMNREKKRMKLQAFRDLLQMTIAVMEDMIRKICYKEHDVLPDSLIQQYRELMRYYNENLDKIKHIHGGAVPKVMELI